MSMDPRRLEVWRKEVLARLDVLRTKARQAQQYMNARGRNVLEDKSDIETTWAGIKGLFPDDLKAARAGDLDRHLGYAQHCDFRDIELVDVPVLEKSVRNYGKGRKEYIEEEIDKLDDHFSAWEAVSPQIRDSCHETFQSGNYRDAARAGIELLMDEIRKLSGIDLDGDALLRKAVGANPGQLGFSPCQNNNEKGVTEGLKQVAQGLFKGIRNPASHGGDELSRIEAFQVLATCSLLLFRLQFVEHDVERLS